MEYEKIKQLMDDMGNSKLTSLDIDFPDGTKIRIKKENPQEKTHSKLQESDHSNESITSKIAEDANQHSSTLLTGTIVTSPMVGTFYMKPSPDAEPYVEIGKNVKKGTILCIIEAMKLMNEIESEYEGKITEIFVKDGESVEYGQPLFAIN